MLDEKVRKFFEENPGVHPELREMFAALNRIAYTFQYGTALNFETDWGGLWNKETTVSWADAYLADDGIVTSPPAVGASYFGYARNWIAEATERWRIQRSAFEFDLSAYDPDTQRIIAARLTVNVTLNPVGDIRLSISEADTTFDADMWVGNLNPLLLGKDDVPITGTATFLHSVPFNEDGVEYLNNNLGGSVFLAIREYDHDFLGVEMVDDTRYLIGQFNTGTVPKIEFDIGYKG